MASSGNKSKSFGMRILWIPGGRKSHPKGRYDSTNKRIAYTTRQKKSEVWTLGGSKTQTELLKAESDTAFLDGPTVSRLAPITCSVGAGTAAATAAVAATTTADDTENKLKSESPTNIPCTPNSTTSTAPLLSSPHSPQPDSSIDSADEMPTKTAPVIVTTTTAEIIIDENRFSILGKDHADDGSIFELPMVPKELQNQHQCETLPLNSSAGTTVSTATTSPATSPKSDNKLSMDVYSSPSRKKHHRNHNNNHHQEDVNSIESITENNATTVKIPDDDLTWIDGLKTVEKNDNIKDVGENSVRKKKKNKQGKTKELDQLDGVAIQKTATKNNNNKEKSQGTDDKDDKDQDEKLVQCLYYALMCCDCTIS